DGVSGTRHVRRHSRLRILRSAREGPRDEQRRSPLHERRDAPGLRAGRCEEFHFSVRASAARTQHPHFCAEGRGGLQYPPVFGTRYKTGSIQRKKDTMKRQILLWTKRGLKGVLPNGLGGATTWTLTLLFASAALYAQVTSSSIFGTVTDSTGAV